MHALKTACDVCIEAVATGLSFTDACDVSDTAACTALSACTCSTCDAEAVAKGECEVTAERADSAITCPSISCASSPMDTPAPGETPGPMETPAPTAGAMTATRDIMSIMAVVVALAALV
ncbi:MAG: hypothetical protein SGARI_007929 [Bacillariaceae sp.]